jgi:hypothetical protein
MAKPGEHPDNTACFCFHGTTGMRIPIRQPIAFDHLLAPFTRVFDGDLRTCRFFILALWTDRERAPDYWAGWVEPWLISISISSRRPAR